METFGVTHAVVSVFGLAAGVAIRRDIARLRWLLLGVATLASIVSTITIYISHRSRGIADAFPPAFRAPGSGMFLVLPAALCSVAIPWCGWKVRVLLAVFLLSCGAYFGSNVLANDFFFPFSNSLNATVSFVVPGVSLALGFLAGGIGTRRISSTPGNKPAG